MSNQRTHYVTTSDGVTIGGTVHGEGPPLVFLQGAIGDGDIDWDRVVGHLTGRFTCHLPSLRGRGLSGDHPDLSVGRTGRRHPRLRRQHRGTDRTGGVVRRRHPGTRRGGAVRRGRRGGALRARDAEPARTSRSKPSVGAVVARTAELAADGRLAAAARAFAGFPFNDEEIAVAEDAGYFEAAGRYVPNLLNLLQQAMAYEGPTADDPAVLGAIQAPVVVLLGSDTKPFFTTSARYVADHVANARVHEIPGAGHAAPLTHPEALAEALTEFFSPAQQRA